MLFSIPLKYIESHSSLRNMGRGEVGAVTPALALQLSPPG